MTYAETLEFLYSALPVFQREGASAYKPGLDNTLAFLALLGDPHQKGIKYVHVAGTNGKGSTSHIIASCLQAAGNRTGLFTSPHLKDFRERIRIDGDAVPEDFVVDFVERWRDEMVGLGLTFFEMCTALALSYFTAEGVDAAVIETGLGGRLDATNVITPAIGVITNIGYDHMAQLGPTLQSIAAEKAGIIKPGVPVVAGCRNPDTDNVFMAAASAVGSPLAFAGDEWHIRKTGENMFSQSFEVSGSGNMSVDVKTDLLGHYQERNILCAFAVCRRMGLDYEHIRSGCRAVQSSTGLRGRWQIFGTDPLMVCDTGHNAHGLKEVVAQLARSGCRTLYFIIGVVADKDLDAMLSLLPSGAHYIFTQPSTPRALDRNALAAEASARGLRGDVRPTVGEALDLALSLAGPEDMIFIGGSTYTVADLPEGLLKMTL